MADNFNINTTQNQSLEAGGIDPSTGLGIGNSLYSSLLRQQSQEEAIRNAQLLNTQQTLANKQAQSAADVGINPNLKGYISKDEAIALINAQIQRQGLMTPEVQKELQAWYDAAPQMVDAQAAREFASKYQPKQGTARANQPTPYTTDTNILVPNGKSAADIGLTDMHDATGASVDDKTTSDGTMVAHVPDDGMYQALYDNDGMLLRYVSGGKTPVDQSAKDAAKQTAIDQKQRTAMNKMLDQGTPSQRTPEGQAAMKIQSGLAAMVLINQMGGNLTPQQMRELATSVANLLSRGGVVAEGQIDALVPHTFIGQAQEWRQYLTNDPTGTGQQAFVKNLADTVNREIGLSQQYLQGIYSSRLSQFDQFKNDKPDQYNADLTAHHIDPQTLEYKPPYHAMLTNAGAFNVNGQAETPVAPAANRPSLESILGAQ